MANPLYKALIVDDHPIIINAYKAAIDYIESNNEKFKFTVDAAESIDLAVQKIAKTTQTFFYDVVFLDIKLPISEKENMLSGEDLGVHIREKSPKTKIIISTTYNDNYRLNNFLKV